MPAVELDVQPFAHPLPFIFKLLVPILPLSASCCLTHIRPTPLCRQVHGDYSEEVGAKIERPAAPVGAEEPAAE